MVGPAGPSPNGQSVPTSNMVANPGLSPFGQPQMSQANLTTTTASVTTSQFPTSNGTTGLSNSSPIHNQSQFTDIMKARLAAQAVQAAQQQAQPTSTASQNVTASSIPQAPSPFSGMQQSQQQQQQNQQQQNQQQQQQFLATRPLSSTTPNDTGLSVSTPKTIPPPASSGPSPGTGPMTNGPQSVTSTPNTPLVPSLMTPSQVVNANQTPPHPGTTPSPAGLGKGMSSQERAALNAPRTSSMSSQMAAITAALDQDNSPSPVTNNEKGKLDNMEEETNVKMEMDQEEGGEGRSDSGSGTGKNVNNDMTTSSMQIKSEIKQEPMEEGGGDANGSTTIKVEKEFLRHCHKMTKKNDLY